MTDQDKQPTQVQPQPSAEEKKLEERILMIRRVSKKTTGGNYITFTVLAAVGDGHGGLGVGFGRSLEIPPAIKKALLRARKNVTKINMFKTTIPHEVKLKYKAAKILLKPAPEGTGLKVGSVARPLLELTGIQNVSGKIIRSRNKIINTYAIVRALKKLKNKTKKR